MPKPTAAPTAIHTPASIAQITSVRPSSSSPWWARRRPSVADAIGASMPCSFSLRRTNRQPTPTRRDPDDRDERDQLDRVAADLAQQPVADDHEQHEQDGDVEQPLGHQRADDGAVGRLRARRHQHDADRVAGARGQDVVAHVADDGERVGVGALRAWRPRPRAAAASARRARRSRARRGRSPRPARGSRPRCAGRRRLLLGRPPDDRAERDERDESPSSDSSERRRRGAGADAGGTTAASACSEVGDSVLKVCGTQGSCGSG